MRQGGVLQKEFMVTMQYFELGIILRSELKDDILLTPLMQADLDTELASGEYQLEMPVGNGRKNQIPIEIIRRNDMFILSNQFLDITLVPMQPKAPPEFVSGWYSPFLDGNRQNISAIKKRLVDTFGAYRSSVQKGHRHAGIDIGGDWREAVFAIAAGKVVFVSYWPANATIVVRHSLPDGDVIYSKYTHLKDITVNLDDNVTEKTRLARLFTEKELALSGFKHNHVHLEIRKSYDDKGRASSYSMTMEALKKYCFDPLEFFAGHSPNP